MALQKAPLRNRMTIKLAGKSFLSTGEAIREVKSLQKVQKAKVIWIYTVGANYDGWRSMGGQYEPESIENDESRATELPAVKYSFARCT